MSDPVQVPDGWKIESVKELAVNHDSKRVPVKSSERENMTGKYPYYGASGIIDYVDDYLFDGEYILLGEDGENVLSRNSPLAFLVKGKFWVNNHAHVLQPKKHVDIGYLCASLEFLDYSVIASGSAQPKINQAELNKIKSLLPPLPEQQKIASILTSVDDVIEKTELQISKLQDLKKGMMQELLTKGIGNTEFKDSQVGRIPKSWKIFKLGQLVGDQKNAIVDGPFGSSINTKRDYISKGVPVIRTVNIRPFLFLENDLKFISETLFEKVKRSAVYPGDVLLSKVGTVGYSCIFPDHIEKAILSTTGSCKVTVNPQIVSSSFLCYMLNFMKPFMDLIASAGVQPFLNMSTIKSFQIKIPYLKEQKEIVNVLNSISDNLTSRERRLHQLKKFKKALMQDLLTGNVRVKVN